MAQGGRLLSPPGSAVRSLAWLAWGALGEEIQATSGTWGLGPFTTLPPYLRASREHCPPPFSEHLAWLSVPRQLSVVRPIVSSELWWLVGPGLILRPGTWEEALGVSSAPLPALSRKHCLWSCWNCQSHCSREPGPHPREEGRGGGGGTLLELPVAGLSDLIAAKEAVTGQASRAGGSTQHVGPQA